MLRSRYVLSLSLLVAAFIPAAAQDFTGEIRLTVEDSSGAAAQASGTLVGVTTGSPRSFETDAQGVFVFGGLTFGRYRLNVAKEGFAPETMVIEVDSSTPVLRTVRLGLGVQSTRVEVIGTAPLPGVELPREQIASAIQTVGERDIQQTNAVSLSDVLNRRLNNVYINDVAGSPFQPDLNYRGYTASPLLGTPQGISVYMDGVRLNQPFGDVVSWDLIPRISIAETTVIPGSDPLFGLNTLGGALSIRSKDGFTNPDTTLQLAGGNFGRRMADLESGGSLENGFNWYGASSVFFEDGWRQVSPSNVRQFLGKIGWTGQRTTLGAFVSYANNQLNGGGIQERSFLGRDYASIYTKPDVATNRSPFLNFTGRHAFSDHLTIFGNVYYRYISTGSFNGDINEGSLDQSLYQPGAAERAALAAAGYTGVPVSGATAANTPFPFWRCIGNVLIQDEPGEKCNGLINRGSSRQHNAGFTSQVTWSATPKGHRNQLTVGGAWDRSAVNFQQTTQLGFLNPDRTVTPVQAFADGVTGGEVDGQPFDARVNLDGVIRTGSVYAADTITLGAWAVTASGRYNRTTVNNTDRISPGGGPGSLDGYHVFERFNPALGVTFNPIRTLGAYARYSEASRAPTSIELGCADPQTPCKLPNAIAGDPPLHQVVAKTFEAGIRGGAESRIHWDLGWFRAENRNDILFVSSPQTGFGYFKNFGKTRRQGMEAEINTQWKRISLGVSYTLLDATFRSSEEVNGSANSTNEEALAGRPGLESSITVTPGNKIPLVPRHMGKAFVDLQLTTRLVLNLSMLSFSSSFARGNENNLHRQDDLVYLGSGKSPGYAVFNLGGRYQLTRRAQLFAQLNNVFDRRYYTGAQLGPMGFTDSGNFIARPLAAVNGEFPVRQSTFYAPGAPRTVWGGVRIQF